MGVIKRANVGRSGANKAPVGVDKGVGKVANVGKGTNGGRQGANGSVPFKNEKWGQDC